MANLNRAQLAAFLPDAQAIRSFEEFQREAVSVTPDVVAAISDTIGITNGRVTALEAQSDSLQLQINELELNDLVNVNTAPVEGDLLAYVSGEWVAQAPYSYTFAASIEQQTADYLESRSSGYAVTLCDATALDIVATLPACVTCSGIVLTIKKVDSSVNTVTITPDGSETVDGASSYVLSSQYELLKITSDGANWHII